MQILITMNIIVITQHVKQILNKTINHKQIFLNFT